MILWKYLCGWLLGRKTAPQQMMLHRYIGHSRVCLMIILYHSIPIRPTSATTNDRLISQIEKHTRAHTHTHTEQNTIKNNDQKIWNPQGEIGASVYIRWFHVKASNRYKKIYAKFWYILSCYADKKQQIDRRFE